MNKSKTLNCTKDEPKNVLRVNPELDNTRSNTNIIQLFICDADPYLDPYLDPYPYLYLDPDPYPDPYLYQESLT